MAFKRCKKCMEEIHLLENKFEAGHEPDCPDFEKEIKKYSKPTEDEVIEFLKESNAIEGVYDDDSLQQAKYAWDWLMTQTKMTTGVVLKTHKILMLHQKLMPYEKGYFRTVNVYIGGRAGANPASVPYKVEEWCKETMKKGKVDSKQLHIEYEKIHPFVDGNGRTGRMFMNWTRVKRNKEPLFIIHEGGEQMEYYKWFRDESNSSMR